MRQWLVRPQLMCQRHLLAEHLETHMFQGSMRGNIDLTGYYENNLFFGPTFLLRRHQELSSFIEGHKTPITAETIAIATAPWPGMYSRKSYPDIDITQDMVKESRMELVSRCRACRSMHLNEKRQGRPHRYDLSAWDTGRNHPMAGKSVLGGVE